MGGDLACCFRMKHELRITDLLLPLTFPFWNYSCDNKSRLALGKAGEGMVRLRKGAVLGRTIEFFTWAVKYFGVR